MPILISLKKIEESIQKSKPEEQQKLLRKLPHLLNIPLEDYNLLKLSEPSFDFWNNPDDVIYDSL
jgi:hypothetical protein